MLLLPVKGLSHPAQFTTLQFTVATGGEFRASLNVDVLAFALGKPSVEAGNEELEALLDGPREALASDLDVAGEQFRREVVVQTDLGDAAASNWRFPGLPEIDAALASHVAPRILIGGEITFSGVLPRGARGVSVRLPYALGVVVHFYTVPGGKGEGQLVSPGEYSNLVKITPPPVAVESARAERRVSTSRPISPRSAPASR